MDEGAAPTSRRRLLAGAGGVAASAVAGCADQVWSRPDDPGPEQVQMTIKTVPADDDAFAATIVSQFRENLQAAGIDATHEPVAEAELYRNVLVEGDYDVFVVHHRGLDEFDALRGLLHSRFVTEHGWQNPFHFSDVRADELLDAQRSRESDRREVLGELFDVLEESMPFTAAVFPHQVGGTAPEVRAETSPRRPLEYVDILSTELPSGPRDEPLRVGVYGEGLTERLNPIVVDRNRIDGLMGLLYDPLVRRVPASEGSDDVPWLAEAVSWEGTNQLRAEITLREGLRWHDGVALDADDVTFTMQFIEDTSLGDVEAGIPSLRFRGRQSLVERATSIDSRTVEVSFGGTARAAAVRALTVPVLPEHVWEPRSQRVTDRQTEAIVTDNEEPIGSGLFRVAETTNERLRLEPFDDHVLRESDGARPEILRSFPQFSGIDFRIGPNAGATVESLLDGEIDVTASAVPPEEVESIRASADADVVSGPTPSFYLIGFNHHHPELGNPHVRRVLSQLIDRKYLASDLFRGDADPATTQSSIVGIPSDRWEDDRESTVGSFPGSEGSIATAQVRSMFEEAGYHYENGALLK